MNASKIDNALVSLDLAEMHGDIARLSAEQTETFSRAKIRLAAGDVTALLALESLLSLTVTMPAYRWADAAKRVTSLATKAKKRGLPQPSITEVARETRDDESVWITARLLGAAPVLNGWRCLATVVPWTEVDGVQTGLVCTATGVDPLPTWSEHPDRCEHCNKNRNRSLTFVVGHEDGRVIQVGKTCLNEYIGTDALAAWFVWSKLRELESEAGGWSYDSLAHAQWLADHAKAATLRDKTPRKLPTFDDFLAACAAEIRVNGYQRHDRFDGFVGTGLHVHRAMRNATHEAVTHVDHETAAKVIAWLDALVALGPAVSSYLDLVLDIAAGVCVDGVKAVDANIVASMIPACLNYVPRVNEYVPGLQAGDERTLELVTERDLGWAWTCRDAAGRTVIVRRDRRNKDFIEGGSIKLHVRVEDLNIYRGTLQTIVRRIEI